MKALDTNLLVRILTRDDTKQAEAVDRLLSTAGHDRFFVPITVMLEIEWVLRGAMKLPRGAVVASINAVLNSAALVVEHEPEVEAAVDSMTAHRHPDFADCLHIAMAGASGHRPLLTFDRRLSRLPGSEHVPA